MTSTPPRGKGRWASPPWNSLIRTSASGWRSHKVPEACTSRFIHSGPIAPTRGVPGGAAGGRGCAGEPVADAPVVGEQVGVRRAPEVGQGHAPARPLDQDAADPAFHALDEPADELL
ncbi:hypothetical protein OG289_41680 [Streptomyces sp. NBC_01235]|nr:hypothetical protein OG289_41680 [Streptomyces sp. NBC_01235]